MAAWRSPMPISVDRTLADTARRHAHEYVRKGGKQNRRKRLDRLCLALDWISREFPACRGLDQIGRKQVWRFYAAHAHLAPKTLAEYGYAFRLLWQLLGRVGEPPFPGLPARAATAPSKDDPAAAEAIDGRLAHDPPDEPGPADGGD